VLHVKHASRTAVAEFCCRRARDGAGAALWASDRAAEALEESDHPRSLCGVGQAPSAGTEIVGYVLEVACSGDHRGHGLVGEEIFEEELARGRRVEVCGPFRQLLPAYHAEEPIAGKRQIGQHRGTDSAAAGIISFSAARSPKVAPAISLLLLDNCGKSSP
jgi:hypothetical protein